MKSSIHPCVPRQPVKCMFELQNVRLSDLAELIRSRQLEAPLWIWFVTDSSFCCSNGLQVANLEIKNTRNEILGRCYYRQRVSIPVWRFPIGLSSVSSIIFVFNLSLWDMATARDSGSQLECSITVFMLVWFKKFQVLSIIWGANSNEPLWILWLNSTLNSLLQVNAWHWTQRTKCHWVFSSCPCPGSFKLHIRYIVTYTG